MNDGVDVAVDNDAGSSSRDGLLYTLVHRLQVYRPVLVLRKPLVRSYLSRDQNYLAITQAEYDRGFRLPGLLTGKEHDRVNGAGGLALGALDRRGRMYDDMVLVGLARTYRLRTGWGRFLRNAGLRQDDDRHVGDVVELWAFRSPAWGTKLGLVLLHYTREEDAQMTMAMSSTGTGGYRHQGQRFALASTLTEEEDEDEEITMAAVTLMCMKRS